MLGVKRGVVWCFPSPLCFPHALIPLSVWAFPLFFGYVWKSKCVFGVFSEVYFDILLHVCFFYERTILALNVCSACVIWGRVVLAFHVYVVIVLRKAHCCSSRVFWLWCESVHGRIIHALHVYELVLARKDRPCVSKYGRIIFALFVCLRVVCKSLLTRITPVILVCANLVGMDRSCSTPGLLAECLSWCARIISSSPLPYLGLLW